jgi:hypothetical protein
VLPLLNSSAVLGRLAVRGHGMAMWLGFNLPLLAYLTALLAQSVVSAGAHGPGRALGSLPLVCASHLCYGLGFWRGWFTRLRPPGDPPAREVVLERMHPPA